MRDCLGLQKALSSCVLFVLTSCITCLHRGTPFLECWKWPGPSALWPSQRSSSVPVCPTPSPDQSSACWAFNSSLRCGSSLPCSPVSQVQGLLAPTLFLAPDPHSLLGQLLGQLFCSCFLMVLGIEPRTFSLSYIPNTSNSFFLILRQGMLPTLGSNLQSCLSLPVLGFQTCTVPRRLSFLSPKFSLMCTPRRLPWEERLPWGHKASLGRKPSLRVSCPS